MDEKSNNMLGNGKQTNISVLRSLFILVKIRIENISLFNIYISVYYSYSLVQERKINTKKYTTVILIFLSNNILKLTLRLS